MKKEFSNREVMSSEYEMKINNLMHTIEDCNLEKDRLSTELARAE